MCVVFLSKDKYLMSEMSVRHRDTRIAHTSIIKNEGSRMKDQGGGTGRGIRMYRERIFRY